MQKANFLCVLCEKPLRSLCEKIGFHAKSHRKKHAEGAEIRFLQRYFPLSPSEHC